MKKGRKNIAFFVIVIFFISTFGITSFVDNALAYTEIIEKTEEVKTVLDIQSTDTSTKTETVQEPANSETSITIASGGAYSLNFKAYDPKYYNFKLPSEYPLPPSGRASDPMPGANGSHKPVESLEPKDLALGQIVPFEVQITVTGNTAPENGVVNFSCLWSTVTVNGSEFGFDPNYKVFAGFVDYGDTRTIDSGTLASVTKITSDIIGTNIIGTFEVSGLNNGDVIIVEMWVVLKSQLPNKINGNVQSRLESAQTIIGDTINTGDQTIPLNQPAKFTEVDAEVSIVKSDTPYDPLYTGDTLTYTITVNNNSIENIANGIVVTDTLDSNVSFISASDKGTQSGGIITWPGFALEPGGQKVFTVTVKINPDAPTENYGGISPDNRGAAIETRLSGVDISNIVKFTMITKDSNINNNVWQEPTNVLPKASITASKVWVGGPAKDHVPVTLTLYRQIGVGEKEVVNVIPTITPSSGTADVFTYTWTGLPMFSPGLQPYTYTVDELNVPAGYTKEITAGNTITNTYKPSLTILKVCGTDLLQGAVFELYAGYNSGKTGSALKTITTGIDGKATFDHLANDTYWIVETKPPTGYKFIDDIGPFKVENGTISGPGGFTLSLDGTTGNYIVNIPNEPIRQLPATGGRGIVPFAVVGLGMMMFVISGRRRI